MKKLAGIPITAPTAAPTAALPAAHPIPRPIPTHSRSTARRVNPAMAPDGAGRPAVEILSSERTEKKARVSIQTFDFVTTRVSPRHPENSLFWRYSRTEWSGGRPTLCHFRRLPPGGSKRSQAAQLQDLEGVHDVHRRGQGDDAQPTQDHDRHPA